jgi:hypothetical protein
MPNNFTVFTPTALSGSQAGNAPRMLQEQRIEYEKGYTTIISLEWPNLQKVETVFSRKGQRVEKFSFTSDSKLILHGINHPLHGLSHLFCSLAMGGPIYLVSSAIGSPILGPWREVF